MVEVSSLVSVPPSPPGSTTVIEAADAVTDSPGASVPFQVTEPSRLKARCRWLTVASLLVPGVGQRAGQRRRVKSGRREEGGSGPVLVAVTV